MILGLVLLYVGAVLFINGVAILGKISFRESAVMNIFAGTISFLICINSAFHGSNGVQFCAYGLLFSITYLWVAYNNLTGQDGRGLGWFSLFVAITAIPIAYDQYISANSFFGIWLAICWLGWSILWFGYFLFGVFQFPRLVKPIAILTIIEAIFTAWLPGYLILSGHMPV